MTSAEVDRTSCHGDNVKANRRLLEELVESVSKRQRHELLC